MKAKATEGILLSIGLIVKNEEKKLRRCLDSLQPLMEAVSSELIIVDTGSHDDTVAIAREYTEQVIEYEWNDDFSAARNVTLDRSVGKWYLYLDADEWLKDWKPIVHFLESKQASRSNTATLGLENYTEPTFRIFARNDAVRMIRKASGGRFQFSVHECLPKLEPCVPSGAILRHDGYVYASQKEQDLKFKRNFTLLLKEYAVKPDDIRILSHIVDCFQPAEALPYAEKALNLVKDRPEHNYYGTIYRRVAAVYRKLNMVEPLKTLCEEYFLQQHRPSLADIDMRLIYADTLSEIEDGISAAEQYEIYFSLYDQFQNGKSDYWDMASCTATSMSPFVYIETLKAASRCYCKIEQFEKAFECIARPYSNQATLDDLVALLAVLCEIAEVASEGEEIGCYFQRVLQELDNIEATDEQITETLEKMVQVVTQYYYRCPTLRDAICSSVALCKRDLEFIHMMQFLNSEAAGNFPERLTEKLAVCGPNLAISAELIYLAIKYQVDVAPILDSMTVEEFAEHLIGVAKFHQDYSKLMVAYPVGVFCKQMKSLCCIEIMLEKAIVVSDGTSWIWDAKKEGCIFGGLVCTSDLSTEEVNRLIQSYVDVGNEWLAICYASEMLTETGECYLPVAHRSLRRLWRALAFRTQGKGLEYVRLLQQLLKDYPPMKTAVETLLKDYQEQQDTLRKDQEEAAMLMRRFKAQIRVMIQAGNRGEARRALASYQTIHPEDGEIAELMALCNGIVIEPS